MEDVEQKVGALLPCPFCGGEVVGREGYDYEETPPRRYWVTCYKGLHEAAVDYPFDRRDEAIAAWNTRTPSAKLAEVERERDEARSQFDHHVVWASDQSAAIEVKLSKAVEALNAAQTLATCCMAAGCYSHEELTEMARATRPVFDEALASLTPSAAIERAGE